MAITMALRRVSPACLRPAARRNAGRMMFNVRAFKEDKPAENEKKEVVPQQKQDKAISQRQPEEVLPFMRMSDAMRQMQREMDAMMHSFGLWDPLSASLLRGSWNLPSLFEDRDWAPVAGPSMGRALSRVVPVEVEESDTAYTLHAEVPGFTKQDIKVMLDPSSNLLTISGEKKAEEGAQGAQQEGAAPRMRSRMSFTRAFTLPQDVDLNQAMTAKTENGVLTLTLPKALAPPKPSVKEITVE